MNINREIRKASVSQLISWWRGRNTPEWANTTTLFHQKVAFALGRKTGRGTRFLKGQLNSSYIKERALILTALANKETYDDAVTKILVASFHLCGELEPPDSDGLRETVLSCLVDIGEYPLNRTEVEALLENDHKWVAAVAMVYLSHAFPDDTVAILRAGLNAANPIKRGKACTQAGFRNIRELEHQVRGLLEDSDAFVARSAQIGCEFFDIVWDHT